MSPRDGDDTLRDCARASRGRAPGVLLVIVAVAVALAVGIAWVLFDGAEAGDGDDVLLGTRPASPAFSLAPAVTRPAIPTLPGELSDSPALLLAPGLQSGNAAAEIAWPAGVVEVCLSGRVVDVRGAPWPGATVVFVPDERTSMDLEGQPGGKPERGSDVLAGLPRALTDAEGRFRLCGPWQAQPGGRFRGWGEFDPSVVISAPGMAWQGHAAAGFTGDALDSWDLGDLVLANPGASLGLRVLDEQGVPLAGVAVVTQGSGSQASADDDPMPPRRMTHMRQDITGEDGRLLVEHRWPGNADIALSKDGYEQLVVRVVFPLGEHVDFGDVGLTQGWSLRGTVRDAQGAPVVGAELMALTSYYAEKFPSDASGRVDVTGLLLSQADSSPHRALSDVDGRFVLGGLPSTLESVSLICRATGFDLTHRDALVPGGRELELVLQPEASLVVDVRSADTGETLVDAELRAVSRTGYPEDEFAGFLHDPFLPLEVTGTRVHRAGRWGTVLFVSAPGHAGQRVDVPPCAPGESREVVVALGPGARLTGVVVDVQGAPIEAAQVTLSEQSGLFDKLLGLREQLTDAAGRFAFEPLSDCVWEGSVEKVGYMVTVLEPLEGRTPGQELHVVLTRAASVRGTLLDGRGEPAVAHWLEATPEGELTERRRSSRSARTDRNGRFEMLDMTSGTWVIRSEPGVEARVSLEPGEQVDLQLQLQPTLRLRGRARSGAAPMPQVKVQANPAKMEARGTTEGAVSTRTGVDGRFTLELPEPGGYTVSFMAREGPWISRTLTVLEGDDSELDVDFGTARIAGTLVAGMAGVSLPMQLGVRLRIGAAFGGYVEADASGHFAFAPLPAGSYTLTTSVYRYLPLTLGPFEVAPGSSIEGLELVLQPAARVQGFAHHDDGEPFDGFAHLRRTDGTPGYLETRVHAGAFDFDSVEPGAWRLDLTTFWEKELGHGDGLRGEPGVELPLIAAERRFELTGAQTEHVEIIAQRVEDE